MHIQNIFTPSLKEIQPLVHLLDDNGRIVRANLNNPSQPDVKERNGEQRRLPRGQSLPVPTLACKVEIAIGMNVFERLHQLGGVKNFKS